MVSGSPRTKRPPPPPATFRNGRPVPIVALHQGHLMRRPRPFRPKPHDSDYYNSKKWEPGRATELAARLGMTRAYDSSITATDRHWKTYDAEKDPHTKSWRQRQALLKRAADARMVSDRGGRGGAQAKVTHTAAVQAHPCARDPMASPVGCVRYWDGSMFVPRPRGHHVVNSTLKRRTQQRLEWQ
eukprot:scaffold203992_cov33-Tisochrysis_lutea.AAC.1